ncbi:MAG: bifunctional diaminohydroxyphosphoribosylaminopyrimidine deaminase/5-amino-6-(5-phosphoribosylamino)uracil reductase RibD [Actinomycetia bacterium]|nr:bifunctional diaminohydroxyphosphoribosylaminopyrimidine deaminase/5-amino-6-(5-phosphoribosylamino)uracil reductase RibD [Actinomycetes bacterium]
MRRAVDNPVDGVAVDDVMRAALDATSGTHPHPNPRVGAVIVSPAGVVRAVGVHIGPGHPHAERVALASLGSVAGDTMVVTLEPCNHQGRTPPCTDAIIDSGIRRVIVGARDPDTKVSGRGIARLRSAGVEVIDSGLASIVEANDPSYYHHRRTGLPLVTLKIAMTLDGQIAARDGSSQWITSPEAREDAHVLRSRNDAVAVGAGTIREDDPLLTVRLDGYDRHQPRPIVFKGHKDLPTGARVLARDPIIVESHSGSSTDMAASLRSLADQDITSVLVEGGATIARTLVDAGLVDVLIVYIGASLAAGAGLAPFAGSFDSIDDARTIVFQSVERIGPDIKITAQIGDPS